MPNKLYAVQEEDKQIEATACYGAEETAVITVEITNPEAIVNQHEGWFTGLAGTVAGRLGMIDLAEKVQEAIVRRLKEELGAENVRISVSGPSEEVKVGK